MSNSIHTLHQIANTWYTSLILQGSHNPFIIAACSLLSVAFFLVRKMYLTWCVVSCLRFQVPASFSEVTALSITSTDCRLLFGTHKIADGLSKAAIESLPAIR